MPSFRRPALFLAAPSPRQHVHPRGYPTQGTLDLGEGSGYCTKVQYRVMHSRHDKYLRVRRPYTRWFCSTGAEAVITSWLAQPGADISNRVSGIATSCANWSAKVRLSVPSSWTMSLQHQSN